MAWFKRKPRNRRLGQEAMLSVKLHSDQVQAARLRLAAVAVVVCFCTAIGLYVLWRSGEWALDRMVYHNPSFAIRRIEVETDGVIKPDQLRRWAGVREGENLMSLDLARVRRDLELVSAIRLAAVNRELPNTLRIVVNEREPVAEIALLTGAPGGGLTATRYQLDDEGFVVKPLDPRQLVNFTNSLPVSLPLITGLKSADVVAGRQLESPQVQAALRLIELHDGSPMRAVTALREVDVASPAVIAATTTDRSQITFGLDDLDQQIRRWRVVFDTGRSNQVAIATLDLSVSNNVPATWMKLEASRPPPPPPARATKPIRPKPRNV